VPCPRREDLTILPCKIGLPECPQHSNLAMEGAAIGGGSGSDRSVGAPGATLEVVCDESGLRLGCLELFVRLTAPPRPEEAAGCETEPVRKEWLPRVPGFVVEEDRRQRVLVHWRGGERGLGHEPHALNGNRALADQTWRVSCAFAPSEPEVAVWETLGMEAVDWLWDGLSALVLALGPRAEAAATAASLFGCDSSAGSGGDRGGASDEPHGADGDRGLLTHCLQELCRRAAADPDEQRFCLGLSAWELHGEEAEDSLAKDGEDASCELRFEAVRFRTSEEAVELLRAAGLLAGGPGSHTSSAAVRRHEFVRVVVFDAHRESLAALHFAHVAGGGYCGERIDSNIIADRQALWALLEEASTGDEVAPAGGCRLVEVLAPLIAGNCKPFLLCSVPARPEGAGAVAEAHGLLDLAERACLVTAQCARVEGVHREDFQLAELDIVLQRLRERSRGGRPATSEVPPAEAAALGLESRPRGLCGTMPTAALPARGALVEDPTLRGCHGALDTSSASGALSMAALAGTALAEGIATGLGGGPATAAGGALKTLAPISCAQSEEAMEHEPKRALRRQEAVADGLLSAERLHAEWLADRQPLERPPRGGTLAMAAIAGEAMREAQCSTSSLGGSMADVVARSTPRSTGDGEVVYDGPSPRPSPASRPSRQGSSSAGPGAVARLAGAEASPISLPAHSPPTSLLTPAATAVAEECRELSVACAALRTRNEAKAARRGRELRAVQAEVSTLREAVEGFEDSCEAPTLLQSFREELRSLRAEAERLRSENAALSGARGQDGRRGAQRAALQQLQAEAAQLRQCSAEMEQGEKRASLVHRCLEEVRGRLDAAKRRQAEADLELAALQPAYGELERQIEESEMKRRFLQGELDKLRRTSGGMRAEIGQLREVRGAVEALPPAEDAPDGSVGGGSGSVERFAALQRKLGTIAPQLMPLCARARSEMEDLQQCCHRLEERQRRLQQVVANNDDVDSGFSCSSAATAGIGSNSVLQRPRSVDTLAGRERGGGRTPPRRTQPQGHGRPARSSSAAASPRGAAAAAGPPCSWGGPHPPRLGSREGAACGPAAGSCGKGGRSWSHVSREPTSARGTPHGESSPPRRAPQRDRPASCERPSPPAPGRAQGTTGYAQAWARGRQAAASEESITECRLPPRPQAPPSPLSGSASTPTVQGTAGVLQDLGLQLPPGAGPATLRADPSLRSKSRGIAGRAVQAPGPGTARRSPRAR